MVAAPRTARLFAALAAYDRRHLVAVHLACVDAGLSADIAAAGLIHDIGKSSLSGRQVSLVDRGLRVVLTGVRRDTSPRVVREPVTGWRLGLALAERHAEIGAARLAALGWPDSVVAAVRDHESSDAVGELATLLAIDHATV